MSFRQIASATVFGAFLATSANVLASPLLPGDVVEVGNVAGSAFTPSPVAGDANGLYTNLTFRLDDAVNKNASAGLFALDYRKAGEGWEAFQSFCLEPDVYLTPFSNPYSVVDLSTSGYNSKLAELWGRHRSSVVDDLSAAAFQVSIWELAYDGDGLLSTGSFQLVSLGAVYNLAAGWLAGLDGTGPIASNLVVLTNSPNGADRQDLLTTAPVPEPGSLALLALGLGGLALRRRR